MKNSIVARMFIGSIMLFWALYFTTSYDQLQEISSAMVLGMALAVMIRWSPWALTSFRQGREGFDFLIVSVFTLVTMVFGQRVLINATRWLARPDWLVGSPLGSLSAWLIATALVTIVLAQDTVKGNIPHANIIWVAVAMFVSGVMSGIAIALFIQ